MSMLIAIEGPDGVGKTTIAKALAKKNNWYFTKEPTGEAAGKKVRQLLRDKREDEALTVAHEDRLEHIQRVVLPALERSIVICDRYYPSTLVYNILPGAPLDKWKKEVCKEQYRPIYQKVLQPHIIILLEGELRPKEGDEFQGDSTWVRERYRALEDVLPGVVPVSNVAGEMTEAIWEIEEAVGVGAGIEWD